MLSIFDLNNYKKNQLILGQTIENLSDKARLLALFKKSSNLVIFVL